jgi:predicted dehydrogenase
LYLLRRIVIASHKEESDTAMVRVGICGFGYWGPNLLRTFGQSRGFRVVAVAERLEAGRAAAVASVPQLQVFETAEELIDDPNIDAVAIATPVSTHFPLARRALAQSKHVLVEKPMCTTSSEGEELLALARANRCTLMVDHTYLFHGAVCKLAELKRTGSLGTISYYDSLRVNLGLFQPDMNVLWDLAPHDFSIIDYLFDEPPVHVEATGYCHLNAGLPDIAYVTLHFASRMIAHLNLSWMSPVKVRRIAIGGSRRMAVWNDLDQDEKLKIYNSGIEVQPEDQRGTIVPSYRIGDIYSPRLPPSEPLAGVVQHFRQVIAGEEESIMDGRRGLRIVQLLEAAQRSLAASVAETEGRRSGASLLRVAI